jgi:hypothetical protein
MCLLTSVILCSLLDFSFLETGTDRLCWNVSAELPLHIISEEHRSHVIWQCRSWFGCAWSSLARSFLSCTNLRQPYICKHQIEGKNIILHSSKYDNDTAVWDWSSFYICYQVYFLLWEPQILYHTEWDLRLLPCCSGSRCSTGSLHCIGW